MAKKFLKIVLMIISVCVPATLLAEVFTPKYATYATPDNALRDRFVPHRDFKADPYAIGDVSRFMFKDWSGPAIPVWTYVPSGVDVENAPILIMMHGAKRNPARYLLEWAPLAQKHGFVVVGPEFSKRNFSGSGRYNRGNVSRRRDDRYVSNDESDWSFSAIEPLFDHTVAALNSTQDSYTISGHSAGSQFTHRFMFHKPDARVKQYILANAGWYTMPDMDIEYPFGLKNSGVSEETLKASLQKPVLVLLGDQDIDMNSSSLSRTDGAMLQGEHRYNRGITFMQTATEQAGEYGINLEWRWLRVEGVGHSNRGTAEAAAPYIK